MLTCVVKHGTYILHMKKKFVIDMCVLCLACVYVLTWQWFCLQNTFGRIEKDWGMLQICNGEENWLYVRTAWTVNNGLCCSWWVMYGIASGHQPWAIGRDPLVIVIEKIIVWTTVVNEDQPFCLTCSDTHGATPDQYQDKVSVIRKYDVMSGSVCSTSRPDGSNLVSRESLQRADGQ